MLQQPIFNNRDLNQSLYQALVNRFHDSLNLATQSRLGECSYGMVPSPNGVMTFMIVAPSRLIAEQLVQEIHQILGRVGSLMAGVGEVAVCIAPPQETGEGPDSPQQSESSHRPVPRQMACKIFPVPGDCE